MGPRIRAQAVLAGLAAASDRVCHRSRANAFQGGRPELRAARAQGRVPEDGVSGGMDADAFRAAGLRLSALPGRGRRSVRDRRSAPRRRPREAREGRPREALEALRGGPHVEPPLRHAAGQGPGDGPQGQGLAHLLPEALPRLWRLAPAGAGLSQSGGLPNHAGESSARSAGDDRLVRFRNVRGARASSRRPGLRRPGSTSTAARRRQTRSRLRLPR